MKIQNQNINPNFRAGMTSAMKNEINSVDVSKVSKELLKQGIQTDFKENKMLAWCSLKSVEIINEINKRFGAKLGLPNAIVVDDFSKMNISSDKSSLGFLKLTPTQKLNGCTPEKTIFFNNFSNHQGYENFWDNLNEYADNMFEKGDYTSNFFLEPVFHEFAHAIHETNLMKKLSPQKFLEFILTIAKEENIQEFKSRYENLLKRRICDSAAESPSEAIACDLTKRTINCLDKELLIPTRNFIPNSPYKKRSFLDKHIFFKPENKLTVVLRDFWNGKIPEYFAKANTKNIELL